MDIYHYYGNDLTLNSQGDLMTADGVVKGQQRIIRRLLTIPGSYYWHSNYGAGLQQYVGAALSNDVYLKIQGLISAQLNFETCVAKSPPPVITLQAIASGLSVLINYTDAGTQTPQVLTFTVTK